MTDHLEFIPECQYCNEMRSMLFGAECAEQALAKENTKLKELLRKLTWTSCEKDNMEFKCVTTCYVIDEIRAVLTPDLPPMATLPASTTGEPT